MSGILSTFGPFIFWILKKYIEKAGIKEAKKKNYYAFLEAIDEDVQVDVANYVAAGRARDATIKRIKKRRIELGIDKNAKPTS